MRMRRLTGLFLAALIPAIHAPASRAQEFDCLIEARETAEIRSPVEALIASVPVKRAERVRRGEVIARLESRVETATVASARARANMQGQLDAARARLDLAKRKLDRAEKLFQQHFISSNARDEAAAEVTVAASQLRETEENQRLAELELRRAEESLALRTLRSPFDGVVIERYLTAGEFATTNIKQPILKLAAINPLHVEVVLPVSQLGSIRIGERAQVFPEHPVGGSYTAKVALIDPVVDAASGTFGVRLLLPNPDYRIPAGLKCRVRFP